MKVLLRSAEAHELGLEREIVPLPDIMRQVHVLAYQKHRRGEPLRGAWSLDRLPGSGDNRLSVNPLRRQRVRR